MNVWSNLGLLSVTAFLVRMKVKSGCLEQTHNATALSFVDDRSRVCKAFYMRTELLDLWVLKFESFHELWL